MTKRHNAIQGIKYDRMLNHAVIVELPKILNLCNSPLIIFEVILLETQDNVFQDIVNNCSDEVLVVTVQSASKWMLPYLTLPGFEKIFSRMVTTYEI
jgi:hypothetical protein